MNSEAKHMNSNDFVNYYEYLQVDSNADLETIERVFRLLAKRYHPDNSKTGNFDKFNALLAAYRVLSDPEKRAAYDVEYQEIQIRKWKFHAALSADNSRENGKKVRQDILLAVYAIRKQKPKEPGIGIWHLEKLLGYPEEVMEFQIWYLKEKGWIKKGETGKYEITVDGVDALEENGAPSEKLKLLPYPEFYSPEQNENLSFEKLKP